MAQNVSIAYLSNLSSKALNDKIYEILGQNVVSKGYNVQAGTGMKLSINKGADSVQSLFIKGVNITEDIDLADAVTIPANASGSSRTDVVYAEYVHGKDAVCQYKIATGTSTVPNDNCCLLATLTVPSGFSASTAVTITPVPDRFINMVRLRDVAKGTEQQYFQIDKNNSGPRLENNGGNLEVRNAADNDFADVKADQFTSTTTTLAPLVVASSVKVTNLNADKLDGYESGNATGQIPISNGTVNTNLNADTVDGKHATDLVAKVTSTDNAVTRFNGTTGDVQNSGVTIDDSNNLSANTLKATVADGTTPMTITSKTLVTNLNADTVDGKHSTDLINKITSSTDNAVVRWDGTTGQIVQNSGVTIDDSNNLSANTLKSTVAQGTAPLTVTSDTTVTNLSADRLDGMHADTNSSINTIAARDASGNLTAKQLVSDIADGTAPLTVTSKSVVANLNVDMLDGKHASDFYTTTDLGAVTDGSAGADLIGATSISGLTGNTVQTLLEALKGYVDAVKQGLDIKDSVRVATTANIALNNLIAIDGVTVVAGDRVLVKNQSAPAQNGIYVAAVGAWAKAADADTSAKLTDGAYVFVEEGTTNANSGWVLSNDGLTFIQFSGAGQITAGTGITKSGNTLSLTSGVITTTGTYKSVTVDTYGRVTGGTNPTTLSGYGITDAAPSSHVGSNGTAHALADYSTAGFMSGAEKTALALLQTKLDGAITVTGQYRRIAKIPAATKHANGEIRIVWQNSGGTVNGSAKIAVTAIKADANSGNTSLAQEFYSNFGPAGITKVRLLFDAAGISDSYLEVYDGNPSDGLTYTVFLYNGYGITLVDEAPGSVTGYTIKEITLAEGIQSTDNIATTGQLVSTVATNTAPLVVSSTTKVTNLNADKLDDLETGNATGQIPVSNGTKNVNLNADMLEGYHAGNASGQIPVSNGTVNNNLNADMLESYHAGNSSGQIPVSNGSLSNNLNADLLDGNHATAFLSSDNASEQIISGSEVRVQSTTSTERIVMEFNETDGSLDFVYYAS